MNSKLKKVLLVVCGVAAIGLSSTHSEAYTTQYYRVGQGNGKHVSYYSKKSNVLWIGDSRTMQMYENKKKQSYVAVWGGHYGYGGSRMRIDYSTRVSDMKKIIKRMIKRNGIAFVVLSPTINDYSGGGGCSFAFNKYMAIYKKLKKVSKKVHILSPCLIKNRVGRSCSAFNNKLKKKVKHYISVTMSWDCYGTDNCHFSKKGLNRIYKKIQKVKKKLTVKYMSDPQDPQAQNPNNPPEPQRTEETTTTSSTLWARCKTLQDVIDQFGFYRIENLITGCESSTLTNCF